MNESVAISNHEFSILCEIVSGRNRKWVASLDANGRHALNQLIANGFVAPTDQPTAAKYRHTDKTELLFAQLCSGISAG
jgi:hypothetical protein